MRLLLIIMMSICVGEVMAQCKSYKLTSKGDTLNCIDANDKKRGKWFFRVNALRGNPGYDEEGEYVDNRKEGVWRRYSTMGDLVSIQNYKWGNLDGMSQFYIIAGLEHEESWRAMNPEKAFDTLQVEDINDENKYIDVIVPNDGKSLKHGTWTWYRPGSTSIIKSEVYFLNKIKTPKTETSTDTAKKEEPKKEKPKEVQQYEKKKSGKKVVKSRDGRVGG